MHIKRCLGVKKSRAQTPCIFLKLMDSEAHVQELLDVLKFFVGEPWAKACLFFELIEKNSQCLPV